MSQYKFALSPRIKGMVEWQLEHYYDDIRLLEEYKRDLIPSATPAYSVESSGGHNANRSTENIAERILTNPYIIQAERSCKAISRVIENLTDIDKQLVSLIYWRRSHTVIGAGLAVGFSKSTTYRHINAILLSIAREIGYVSI